MADQLPDATRRSTVLLLRDPDETEVRVQVFPRDPRLAREVRIEWRRLAPDRADGATFRDDLQARLRRLFPLLEIHTQETLGAIRDDEIVWYVFRDGAVSRTKPWRNELHEALGRARETNEIAQRTIDRSVAAVAEASQPRPSPARRAASEGSKT